MDGGNSNKRKGEALQDQKESDDKRQCVTMRTMEVFDCATCSKPLRPPIFQCSKWNFICSPCHEKLPESERTASQRCYGMERVVDNIVVRCKHGCGTMITYYQKEKHERGCPKGPCFCPVSGCGFVAGGAALLDHLTTLHKLPTKSFEYSVPFNHPVQLGSHVLCGGYSRLFLLDVASHESLGYVVSLVCVQPETPGATIGCSVRFSCFKGNHCQESKLGIGMSSMSDGLPSRCSCVVPKVSGGETNVVLTITIYMRMYAEDDDDSYDEEVEEEEEEEDDSNNEEDDNDKVGDSDKEDD